MATRHSRSAARLMLAPAVILLLGWMLVPLMMTLFFSFKKYLPLRGGDLGWVGFENYDTNNQDGNTYIDNGSGNSQYGIENQFYHSDLSSNAAIGAPIALSRRNPTAARLG